MVQLRRLLLIICLTNAFTSFSQDINLNSKRQTTICNPVNLSYRFCLDEPSRREAADPTMITYKGEYYLFASKSGGYFHSADLVHWDLITTKDLPVEDYAPTAVVMNDTIYFMASGAAPVTIYSRPSGCPMYKRTLRQISGANICAGKYRRQRNYTPEFVGRRVEVRLP